MSSKKLVTSNFFHFNFHKYNIIVLNLPKFLKLLKIFFVSPRAKLFFDPTAATNL